MLWFHYVSVMNGYKVKYLFYKDTKKSEITIPRSIIEGFSLNWNSGDDIYIVFTFIKNYEGLFLYKRSKSMGIELYSYIDANGNPVIPYGYASRYLYYKTTKKSTITIPRTIIEAANLNWKPKDDIFIVLKKLEATIPNHKTANKFPDKIIVRGLFLFKKKE